MTTLNKILYTAKAHTVGGRHGGSSRTDDGRLVVELSDPGTPGAGTNPEQLFAVGWSTCFLSALHLVAGKKKMPLPSNVSVDAEIDLGLAQGSPRLAARLNVNLPGMDQETARSLVEGASRICPYSLATSGNIAVTYSPVVSEVPVPAVQAQSA